MVTLTGGYDTDFFFSNEDNDLSIRGFGLGFTTIYCPEIIVYHRESVVNRVKSRHAFYTWRNEAWIMLKSIDIPVMPIFFIRNLLWIIQGSVRGLSLKYLLWSSYGYAAGLFRFTEPWRKRRPLGFKKSIVVLQNHWSSRSLLKEVFLKVKKWLIPTS